MPTPQQLQEALELGDESYGIGAAALKATVAEVTVSFKPMLSSLAQFREAVRKFSIDGGTITSFNKTGAVVIANLEPGDLPLLKSGRVIGKFGSSTAFVVRTRVLK